MTNVDTLHQAILERLSKVIDPETGEDVVRMRLIEDLAIDERGRVACKFRPSSPFCPIAVPLAQTIQQAIAAVNGVSDVLLEVVGFALSNELTALLRQALMEQDHPNPSNDYNHTA
jgi:metal-sulfur cluster biosynthetic enzyme